MGSCTLPKVEGRFQNHSSPTSPLLPRSPACFRSAFSSLYRAIALILSWSIINFCDIDKTASVLPEMLEEAPRGNFLNSGGALAVSFNLRGAEEDVNWNSFGRPACLSIRGGGDTWRAISWTFLVLLLVRFAFLASARASFSDFALLRVTTSEVWKADFTRGLKSSSTLLNILKSKSEEYQRWDNVTDLLKCWIDSPGWIVKDIAFDFFDFSLLPLPIICPVPVLRFFPIGPSSSPCSSCFRFFKFHSSLIACALRTRAAAFGMASFRNDSFSGANSDPLSLIKKKVDLVSRLQAGITFPYGSVRALFSSHVCVACRYLKTSNAITASLPGNLLFGCVNQGPAFFWHGKGPLAYRKQSELFFGGLLSTLVAIWYYSNSVLVHYLIHGQTHNLFNPYELLAVLTSNIERESGEARECSWKENNRASASS